MKQKIIVRWYLVAAFVAAAAIAVVHSIVYIGRYDFTVGLWQHGVSLPIQVLSYLLLVPMAFLALGFARLLKKAEAEEGCSASPFGRSKLEIPFLCLPVAALAATLVAQVAAYGTSDKLYTLLDEASLHYLPLTAVLQTVMLVLALPAASYFVSHLFHKEQSVATGLFTIVYFTAYALRVYFDMTMQISNPRWSFRTVVLIAVMLYFVFEVHQLIKAEKRLTHLIVAFVAMTLAFTEGLSSLIFAVGFYTSDGWELTYSVMIFTVALYIGYRLMRMTWFERIPEVVTDLADPTAPIDGSADEPIEPLTDEIDEVLDTVVGDSEKQGEEE